MFKVMVVLVTTVLLVSGAVVGLHAHDQLLLDPLPPAAGLEPASLFLLGCGLVGFSLLLRQRRGLDRS